MDEESGDRDALPRTAALLLGTLALATAFIAAHVGVRTALGVVGLLTATALRPTVAVPASPLPPAPVPPDAGPVDCRGPFLCTRR